MFRVVIIGIGKWGKNYISTIEKYFSHKIDIVAVSRLNIKKKILFLYLKVGKDINY